MISCEKASLICNKAQYDEASFFEKIKLKYHLLICKTCAKFTKQNTDLTTLCQQANLKSLTEEDKHKMMEELKGKL